MLHKHAMKKTLLATLLLVGCLGTTRHVTTDVEDVRLNVSQAQLKHNHTFRLSNKNKTVFYYTMENSCVIRAIISSRNQSTFRLKIFKSLGTPQLQLLDDVSVDGFEMLDIKANPTNQIILEFPPDPEADTATLWMECLDENLWGM